MLIIRAFLLISCFVLLTGFSLSNVFSGNKEKFITKLKPGPYVQSTQAVGVDKDLDNQRATGNGLISSDEFSNYLNGVLDKLLASASIQGYPGKVFIRASTEWGAETTADGNILINYGALRNLENEDQVAALIAHELSHALLTHHNSSIFTNLQNQFQTVNEWVVTLKQSAIAKNASSQLSKSDTNRLLKVEALLMLSEVVLLPAWNRDQEFDADKLGVDLMVKSGYNTYAMLDLLEMVQSWEADYAPLYDLKNLGEHIHQTSTDNSVGINVDVGGMANNLFTSVKGSLSKGHPDTAERLKEVKKYTRLFYRDVDQPEANVKSLSEAKKNQKTARIFKNYELAFLASKTIPTDINKAKLFADSSMTGETASQPYPLAITSQIYEALGNNKKAEDMLLRATKQPATSGLVYIQLADMYLRKGQADKALLVASEGYGRLNKAPNMTPNMIRYYRKAGKNGDANLTTEECAIKSPSYKSACRQANSEQLI